MEIKMNNFEYFIDYIGKRLHLLEKKTTTFDSVVNLICDDFLRTFIQNENLLADIIDFEWIIYCSSGVVVDYRNHSLTLIPKQEEWLHRPFLEVNAEIMNKAKELSDKVKGLKKDV